MVNDNGESEAIFDGIVGHRSNQNAVSKDDRHLTINGTKFPLKLPLDGRMKLLLKLSQLGQPNGFP
jgi:hypothetical protein